MSLFQSLQPFVVREAVRGARACELCGARIDGEHSHVADVDRRALACACRPCALLFTGPGAARGRWRTVPDRYVRDPSFTLTDAEWEALGIPVAMAFFFKSTSAGRWIAVYPSPAGPVESVLRLEAWSTIGSRSHLFADIEPDVEALLVTASTDGFECMLVPIHACYVLVGHVRRRWRGLDGGDEARAAVAEHLASLRARCDAQGAGS